MVPGSAIVRKIQYIVIGQKYLHNSFALRHEPLALRRLTLSSDY
jgi:hypothetical protein